ncbi:MAG: hypothetical protein AAB074_03450 [Planctomycetota bacterium]
MSTRNLLAALLLLAPAVLGCESKSGKELKKRPPSRESSAKLALPPGGTWSSAVMVTESGSFERAYGGRGGIGSATFYYARTTLLLARSGGGEDRVQISAGSLENTDANAVLEASDRQWRLAAPSDGRGVAYAPERVEEWRWVALESAKPFACSHLVLEAKGGDPCASAPRWLDFALEMMAPPDPKRAHPEGPDQNEWPELAALVSRDWGNEALLKALTGAALRERSGLALAGVERGALQAIQSAVAFDLYPNSGSFNAHRCSPEIRVAARSSLKQSASSGSVVASNAALLLGHSNDAEDQRAMAAALVSEDWAPPATVVRDLEWPRALAWSLSASACSPLSRFPNEVQAAMIEWLNRGAAKPESALPLVFALVGCGSAESRAKLSALSATDADGETPAKPDPVWPATLDELWQVGVVDHGALTHPIDAWIRAALKARK